MAGYVTRDGLLGRFALAEEEYTSEVFGGTLVLREETRAAFRAVRAAAGDPRHYLCLDPAAYQALTV